MKKVFYILIPAIVMTMVSFKAINGRLISRSGHISFYSHTPLEDITAHNYKVVSTIDPGSGSIAFSVPMQSFEFEKALMQEHYNGKDFLNTKAFPKAKFEGTIQNIDDVRFAEDGVYEASVKGNLTIKDITKPINEKGTITVKGNTVNIRTKFNVVLADYGITFRKGKPSTNIGKEIEVTVDADHLPE
ncbi:MAG: YceI family protein [Cyclobacteriaceae bacterium]